MKRPRSISAAAIVVFGTLLFTFSPVADLAAKAPSLSVLYPKNYDVVGRRVNVVVDPMTDWSTTPYFQVIVDGKPYPVVDTSSGRHAVQGVDLTPGVNTITVNVLVPLPGKKNAQETDLSKKQFSVSISRSLTVYNREGSFDPTPPSYEPQPFHSPEHEEDCTGCHRLDAEPQDYAAKKPEDVLCYACHRKIPTGKYIHGPAALWSCLSCHDPKTSPYKYQFSTTHTLDPQKPVKPGLTIKETCEKCHPDIMSKPFKHGPASDGLCTLCHDPHAGNHPAWLRIQSWKLCTTCHSGKKTGVHVISGFQRGISHPTKRFRDPSRPGRRLSCESCHTAHSSLTRELLRFDVRSKFESCRICHRNK